MTTRGRPLSVSVLHPSFEVWGGAEWFAHQAMQALVEEHGCTVALYTHRWHARDAQPRAYSVTEHRIGAYDTGPWDWDLIAGTLAREWARHDVLWVHNYPATEWVAAAHARGVHLPPAVWCCQEPPVALFPTSEAPTVTTPARCAPTIRDLARWAVGYRHRFPWRVHSKRRLHQARSRLGAEGWVVELTERHLAAVKRIHLIHANSRYTAGRIRRLYGREPEVVYPVPRDLADFAPPAGLRKDPMVLWVGRMMPAKRPLELLDAWVAACGREPRLLELTLTFVGEGPLRPVLQNRLHDLPQGVHVELPARVSRPQLVALYQKAMLTVHLAGAEPFGLVPVESMAAGTPVLAHHSGGVRETVVDGETGWCVHNLRGEVLVTMLASLPACTDYLETAGLTAVGRVSSMFRFEETLSSICHILEEAAAGSAPGCRA